jgi:hypothetical protein
VGIYWQPAQYPKLQSVNRSNGQAVPWSALSALTTESGNPNILYSVEDSFFGGNRVFTIDVKRKPALIVNALPFSVLGVQKHILVSVFMILRSKLGHSCFIHWIPTAHSSQEVG